ncbi:hypothetical protein HUJ04_013390 [Dendroctonus ponderosae]|uniref:MD-2-related lipid-recognition domain-containing protein n=1 Tax=Dendroctonus ponderosae TaxID=77166 RepID=A0AAR5Q310_DENPD|nr:hypothetical protein HUJ04_013390 [Dendroctonus ponderosae]
MFAHWKIVLCLVFVQASPGYSNELFDFIECGGDPVQSVTIDDCSAVPCTFQFGRTYHVQIKPEYINPEVDNAPISLGILQYGAYFEQNVTVNNPCVFGCPITTRLEYPEFDLHFNVSSRLVQLPSIMRIESSYLNGGTSSVGFCIEMDTTITN